MMLARWTLPALAVSFTAITIAQAQQAPPGSPEATQTLDGRVLPQPAAPFGGEINLNAFQSKPWWQPRVVPPQGAPNVLLIMTDDVGFGAPSTFGGVIPTPNLDRIANNGLRYTQFHSTALCSPTRAALITGRNHHSVGFGQVTEAATGFPGYDSIIEKDSATLGRILRENGYATSWFGKDHNTPAFQASQAGPFDQWPLGMGFEYFYGFVGGDTSQWQPNLFRNTTAIYPYLGNPGWNLTTAMADDAVAHIKMLNAVEPDKPFFVYYVPGGTHAPHHPTPEWIEKFKGKFDMGWNALRDQIFANQKKLGVIPQDAALTPWPQDLLKNWDSLSADEKKLFTRQAEVYAAYLAYTDYEIGRVIQAVEDAGKLDNTLIVYISGDNGSSAEGSPNGTPNEVAQFNGAEVPVADQLKYFYDVWGSDRTYNHMAVGWTWAFDTPYKWTKQVASHFGGTRQGMAISWPKVIADKGGIRNQFHHVIDIVPTILEATKIQAPVMVDGIAQKPIEGISLAYTWDKAAAAVPTRHRTQYFEMLGNRGLYHDGWYANTVPISAPWNLASTPNPDVANGYKWELYDLTKDWTQNNDVAAANPAKLRQMQELFLVEAAKYQVLPLDNSIATRMVTPRPSVTAGRSSFTYSGPLIGIPMGDAPQLLGTSYRITAEIEVPQGGAEGMLITQGGRFGGHGFYLNKGKPVYVWNLVDLERVRWEGKDALSPGKHTLVFELTYDGLGFGTLAFNSMSGLGRSATGVLKVDDKVVATQKMERTIPLILQWDESLDIGSDTGTPVDDKDYQVPFKFTGTLNKVTIDLNRPKLTPEDQKRLMEGMQRSNKSSE
ncbi:arylsulfatase [Microvirga flavescens]|uniref:arylsulfatase n=1 Tax=Microvirga flavescens TaxID=2249811 RepID=UPI000DDA5DB1|nr:arylsulfatase [Microvirga flavescens]